MSNPGSLAATGRVATAERADKSLQIEGLSVRYGEFPAVTEATVSLGAGQVLGLVGESGSGKSSLALAISRLLPPVGRVVSGRALLGSVDLLALEGEALRRARGELVAYIPQDASAALNPVQRVGRQVAEVFCVRHGLGKKQALTEAVSLFSKVGIRDPAVTARRYPHELSGGMRQRVMIAIALALRPALLVADEPTTALDVTVQAEILALVKDLQADYGTTLVWITHDMGVVAEIADEIAVMYGGRLVENGSALDVFRRAVHPYTSALLSSFTSGRLAAPKEPFLAIDGSPPVDTIPPGCPFHPRCVDAFGPCPSAVPEMREVAPGHRVACHLTERP
ncbi:MAG: ABC transporter ATP-binding protein [Acidimicrobiales bacterium]